MIGIVMNLPTGYLLQNGKYKLTHVVGQGGFGITYKGVWYTDVKGSLGAVKAEVPVCIKEYFFRDYCYRDPALLNVQIHSETGKFLFEKFKEKLIKEANILSDVHHPHIVNVLEVFEQNNTAYIVMEYISGSSLKYLLEKNGIFPEKLLLKYIKQIGSALSFVHDKNILHLDIKPSNILVDHEDNARLIDFGVSKRYNIEHQETSTTMLTLSKGFASIEQYDDEGTQVFSPCPDVYSLGATMYNLLTGKIPVESILRATKLLPPPSTINPTITAKTEFVILKAMQIVQADRFQSIDEMMKLLDDSASIQSGLSPSPQTHESQEGDETTLLNRNSFGETQTLIQNKKIEEVNPLKSSSKKKKRLIKWLLFIFCILIFACIAIMVRSSMTNGTLNKDRIGENNTNPVAPLEDTTAVLPTPVDDIPLAMEEDGVVEEPAMKDKRKVSKEIVKAKKPDSESIESPEGVQEPSVVVNMEDSCLAFIASGNTKMASSDYSGARSEFEKARTIKQTEELDRLISLCVVKEKEEQLLERIKLYERIKTFGKLTIVRNKVSNRYGAIDANIEERIPCKYLNVGLVENGRSFEREDHLFDFYNSEGVLIVKGSPYSY